MYDNKDELKHPVNAPPYRELVWSQTSDDEDRSSRMANRPHQISRADDEDDKRHDHGSR